MCKPHNWHSWDSRSDKWHSIPRRSNRLNSPPTLSLSSESSAAESSGCAWSVPRTRSGIARALRSNNGLIGLKLLTLIPGTLLRRASCSFQVPEVPKIVNTPTASSTPNLHRATIAQQRVRMGRVATEAAWLNGNDLEKRRNKEEEERKNARRRVDTHRPLMEGVTFFPEPSLNRRIPKYLARDSPSCWRTEPRLD
jgi:hypothetical protein